MRSMTDGSGILALARPDIVALEAYSHASWDPAFGRLHANELPWRAETDPSVEGLNRYPEPHPHALAERLAALYDVRVGQLLPGRGSDESIDLLTRGFCRAGVDNVIICPPTFGMYSVAARIQGAQVREVPLDRARGFTLDARAVLAACDANTRIVFLCSPNNPTGNLMDEAEIKTLLGQLTGRALVVVDEAYVEFAGGPSWAATVVDWPNLVVLRTLSKAYGLAGARVGSLIAHPDIVALLGKVIPPYSIPQLTIETVLATLSPAQIAVQRERWAQVRAERERVRAALAASPAVRKVWHSDANFLLVEFGDPDAALRAARGAKLLIRDMRAAAPPCLRISVGTREQNDRLLGSFA
jgi:histidinol-phosphate aminotransferase